MKLVQQIPYPKYTTAERDAMSPSPVKDMVIENTDNGWKEIFNGTTWERWIDFDYLSTFETIYSSDGTLPEDRTIELGGNNLSIEGINAYFSINDNNAFISVYDNATDNESTVGVTRDWAAISYDPDTGGKFNIELRATYMKITDNVNSRGIEYDADYSTNYTNRTLVDKNYVDTKISTISVSNGLTKNTEIELGGTLIKNTLIGGSAVNFNLDLEDEGSIHLSSTDGDAQSYIELLFENGEFGVKNSANKYSKVSVDVNYVQLIHRDNVSGLHNELNFGDTGIYIRDTLHNKGIKYYSDYSANFTNRSLVDKEYTDTAIISIWNKGLPITKLTSQQVQDLAGVDEFQVYFNTDDDKLVIYINSEWKNLETSDMYVTNFKDRFESGDFATGGWNVVNDSTNVWIVGNVNPSSGTYSAYISDDGTNPQYTVNSPEISHLYIDIPIPAGITEAILEFDFLGEGEVGYDHLRVFNAPTSVTPTSGNTVNSTYLIGNSEYNNQSIWKTETINLGSADAGTTRRFIFSWENDGSVGTNPSAMIDNVKLKTK